MVPLISVNGFIMPIALVIYGTASDESGYNATGSPVICMGMVGRMPNTTTESRGNTSRL